MHAYIPCLGYNFDYIPCVNFEVLTWEIMQYSENAIEINLHVFTKCGICDLVKNTCTMYLYTDPIIMKASVNVRNFVVGTVPIGKSQQ